MCDKQPIGPDPKQDPIKELIAETEPDLIDDNCELTPEDCNEKRGE